MTEKNIQHSNAALIGGIEKRDIVLEDYNPAWENMFSRHRNIISSALGDHMLSIEHIGSTAVPGLPAKPIIDILVIVKNAANEDIYLKPLEKAGYELRVREPDWYEHRMFRTPEKDVHIHVYSQGCPENDRYLVFRDYLRANPDIRDQYAVLKKELAKKDWENMNAYADAKSDFIDQKIAEAQTGTQR